MEPNRRETDGAAPDANARRRLRGKNLALLAVLIGLVALFYVVAMVRMSGGAFP